MVLKTVSLTKRIGSDNWYYRRAIPADVQHVLHDRPQDSRPEGWYRTHISISLRTSDRNVARARGAVVASHTERLIAELRGDAHVLAEPTKSRSVTGVAAPRAMRITALAGAWHDAGLNRGVRERDAKRWKAVAHRFQMWLGSDDLDHVTPEKVQAWADERNAAGIAAKTINDTDIAALRAIFAWGRRRGWLFSNPAENVRIEGRGKKRTREKWFLEHEIAAILNAALAVQGTKRENPKTTAAKRWVPWLCAYSGARVVEMIQLRKEDVRQEGNAWVIRINPEAGDVKTDDYRDVPVHEHLIATGFIEFWQQSKPGHLFCDVGKDGTTAGTADGVYKRVYTMVRGVLPDSRVQPNHAWRYTFKTHGHDAGLNDLTVDAICGHAARTQGEAYRGITVKKRLDVMAAFPRYKLTDVERAEAA
ncbi:DUF6538 domain-containing protein [Bradyrhizobium sp. USDA 3650]